MILSYAPVDVYVKCILSIYRLINEAQIKRVKINKKKKKLETNLYFKLEFIIYLFYFIERQISNTTGQSQAFLAGTFRDVLETGDD